MNSPQVKAKNALKEYCLRWYNRRTDGSSYIISLKSCQGILLEINPQVKDLNQKPILKLWHATTAQSLYRWERRTGK